jgi:hypothetical protein
LRKRQEEEELANCTFHPETKDFSSVEKIFVNNNKKNRDIEEELSGKFVEGNGKRPMMTSTRP